MASQFLPEDAEAGVQALLVAQLVNVRVGSVGELDVTEKGELIFDPPCVRTLYLGSVYSSDSAQDNSRLTYNVDHMIDVVCADEDLRSSEAQREATKKLLGRVLPILAGARVPLQDGSKSEPIDLRGIRAVGEDNIGTIYALTIAVPGIAQFDGVNA